MDWCHRDHPNASLSAETSLSFRARPSLPFRKRTCSPVSPRTSECSRITIPIGQATLSRYKRTVTVHCIFFEPYILSRLNRLQSFKPRAVWLPPLKTGASGSLKWGCFGKLIASVQPSILLPIHLEGHVIHFECDLPLFFNKLLTRGQLCVKNSLLCSTNTEQLPLQAINKAKFQFK